jgi:ferrous iron transport protein B
MRHPHRIALLGNPNTGKTTLFNRLSGLRHKTSNFPGTTLEARVGRVRVVGSSVVAAPCGPECGCSRRHGQPEEPAARGTGDEASDCPELIDLPGVYSLELDQLEAEICRAVLQGRAAPRGQPVAEPSAICVVADATNLPRSLMLVGEALRRRLPTVVAVNMVDLARRRGIRIDAASLSRHIGCEVVCLSARTGEGLAELAAALAAPRIANHTPPPDAHGLKAWADALYDMAAAGEPDLDADSFTDRLDRVFTHPVVGLVVFAAVMTGLFYTLFSIARFPMDWIGAGFDALGEGVKALLPPGALRELLADGVINGVGTTVTFLPQICLLFFLIAVLEDTGYLARGAFVVDRLLRPFGLPGHAFVPLLSSHACALPGIMSTRAIPDPRERLATILVAPFMSCSARLPVYVLVTLVLFPRSPGFAALAFVGCYALGIVAGIFSALIARRTLLRGKSRPMALELPTYKRPSVRTALLSTWDRAAVFLKKAGTNILAICVILWWLGAYPKSEPPGEAVRLREQAAAEKVQSSNRQSTNEDLDRIAGLEKEADRLEARHQKANSFAGRLGRAIQPVLAPLGYDRQLALGILTSFAAREVFVSTMSVVLTGEEDKSQKGIEQIAAATRDDGSPVFTRAVCWSLLVYYVLAMQCLPTLAVTAREAGGVKWAVLQLVWMSGLAYVAAMVVFQVMR